MAGHLSVGAVIHTHELSDFWIDQAKNSGINVLGLHPVGGKDADRFLLEAIDISKTEKFKSRISELRKAGILIEYEMHALSFMVPKSVLSEHPDWARTDRNGVKNPDYNICASNSEALEYVSEKAKELAEIFQSDTHRYHFWIDDVSDAECHCEKCSLLSPADQALKIYNAIARGVKKADKYGKQCYLAYRATLDVPKNVTPEENIFLEYAPICRDITVPIDSAESEKNRSETAKLDSLIGFFGADDAKVLEYWTDNSLLSEWKMPIKKFTLTPEIIENDVGFYLKKGFKSITSFACYLGDEYVKQNGDIPDIKGYVRACRKAENENNV